MSEIIKKIKTFRWQQFVIILMMATVLAGTEGCKSTGKLSKKERKAQIENAKKQLQPIIAGATTLTYEEQKRIVDGIMNKNYGDPILDEMIIEAQKKLKSVMAAEDKMNAQKADIAKASLYDLLLNKDNKSADELQRELDKIKAQNIKSTDNDELMARLEKKIQEMRSSGGADLPLKSQLENAFSTIANAASAGNLSQADATIQKTLQYFLSDEVPVLIIISREGSMVDYDKPTNIKRYLNLLKDTKANKNAIDAIMTDANGKIKGLDLIKK